MWCLGRFLPILIGDLVPEEHCYWENFLTLLDIVNELFAPVTTTDRADYVSLLVEVFLGGFKELYPTRPLTPKMHYMVHLATWTKRYYYKLLGMCVYMCAYMYIFYVALCLYLIYFQMWPPHTFLVHAL